MPTIPGLPAAPNNGLGGPALTPDNGPPLENTLTFNPDQVELRWLDNRWQLFAGPVFLKDFGRYQVEGQQVQRVIQELRLNTLNTLGSPQPILEYWLANGQAPHGNLAGLRALPIDGATLKAEQVQGQWCVHDGSRILFNFGPQADACRQAVATIHRYGFTEVAYVGQAAPVMLVFLANAPAAAPTAPPSAPAASRFPHLFGGSNQQPQANAAAPQQPGHTPAVPSQPPAGNTPQQPGGVVQAALRLPGTEAADRVAIDGRQLQVRHDGGDWKLAMGNHVIANFGPSQGDAQLAQAALRYYRCTEQVFVGNPRPMFSYFLSNGQAPHGTTYAFNAVTFRPDSLQVRQLGATYVLYDGTQVLMSFGERATEAQQALEAIQRYKFDRLATFGRGDQSMMLFVRSN
jgi:hypothetical protein